MNAQTNKQPDTLESENKRKKNSKQWQSEKGDTSGKSETERLKGFE